MSTPTNIPTEPMSLSQASTYQRLRAHLAELKLTTAAEHLPGVLEQAAAEGLSMTAALERLLGLEVEATEARRLAGRLRFASLPSPATLEGFDLEAAPGLAADLTARCHKAAIEGRWATTMRFYAGPTLLVIDELGYLPLPAEAASALFQVVSQRYLKTSIILTTNRGVGSWGEVLGDTTVAAALLDRLLHRSVVLNLDGDSYRLRAHQARADTLRRTTTGTPRPLQ